MSAKSDKTAGREGAIGKRSLGAAAPVAAALPSNNLERRFSIAEVAEAFGREPRTVRSWIERGLLEREKIGGAVFIRVDQIEEMLRRSEQGKNRSKIKRNQQGSKNSIK